MQLRLKKEKSTQKDALLQVRAAILFYKSMPQISEDRNPLLFWKSRDSSGSMLAPLIEGAAEVLANPATEAICERIFRRAGDSKVLTNYRRSLLGSFFARILNGKASKE